jgi:serine/threonine protein kinase
MLDFINNYIKTSKLDVKEKLNSDFHDIYIVEDKIKNKKLIKYIKGKRRPKIAIKDIYKKIQKFSHKNIISIYEIIEQNDDFFVVMEYFEGINLNQYIKRNFYTSSNPNLTILKNIFGDIAKTIDFINQNNLIHTDIIGHNILINQKLDIKIIDFDFAILVEDSDILNTDVYSFLIMFYQYINEYNYLHNKYDLFKNIDEFKLSSLSIQNTSCIDFLNSTKIFK